MGKYNRVVGMFGFKLRAKGIVVMVVMKGVGDEWVVVLIGSLVMSGMGVVMVMKMMSIRRLGKMEGSSWVQSSDNSGRGGALSEGWLV
ncbi:hypothetical protein GOBAR_DD23956 [Gossypium barbadense]|nr:hypothetical protein GOBAR_DD23956 [Gossypium barbadense]